MPNIDDTQIASRATARFQRVSARKARLLANIIRGKTVREATSLLLITHRPSAGTIVSNLLKSAIANVDRGQHPETDHLVIGEIKVDDGPIMYRVMPKARGRSARVRKRFCHITMKLVGETE